MSVRQDSALTPVYATRALPTRGSSCAHGPQSALTLSRTPAEHVAAYFSPVGIRPYGGGSSSWTKEPALSTDSRKSR